MPLRFSIVHIGKLMYLVSLMEWRVYLISKDWDETMFLLVLKGTLRFGLIDVTEAQLGIIFVQIVSGIFGCSFWSRSVRLLKSL